MSDDPRVVAPNGASAAEHGAPGGGRAQGRAKRVVAVPSGSLAEGPDGGDPVSGITTTGPEAGSEPPGPAEPGDPADPADPLAEASPPPEDLNDDLVCGSQDDVGPTASGTVTNRSGDLAGYMITVGFVDEAGTRVADGTAFVNGVQPGQTAAWEAVAFREVAYATCEVVAVDRLSQ